MAEEKEVGGVAEQHAELPLEIWEMILGKLESSMDIMNTLKALPQLYGRVMPNSNSWLLDQALPFLFPWLYSGFSRDTLPNIRTLRQVSKRWLRAVDNLLTQTRPEGKSHPDHPGMEVARPHQYGIPEGYPGHHDSMKFSDVLWAYFFANLEKLDLFTQTMMETHSPQRNPFITRHIAIYKKLPSEGAEAGFFWIRFLEQFGRHIWRVGFMSRSGLDELIISPDELRTSLAELPHLKALSWGEKRYFKAPFQPFQFTGHFPALPELETLYFECEGRDGKDYVSHVIIRSYSSQVKRLVIDVGLWLPDYSNMFPKLEELTIRHRDDWLVEANYYSHHPILPSLNAPLLSRLELWIGLSPLVFENYVVPSLVRFPNLRNLLVRFYTGERSLPGPEPPAMPQPVVILPSIKYFKMSQRRMRLDVLKYFPNLECLRVETREHFLTNRIFELEAWEVLPSLKEMVYVSSGVRERRRDAMFRYTRAKYEYLKEEGRHPLEPEDIFQAFGFMISDDWGN